MKRILILGTSGFVGTHVALALRDQYRVLGSYDRHPVQLDRVLLFRMPLHNPEDVTAFIERMHPNALIYCVAERDEQKCRAFQQESFYLNAELASICAATLQRWNGHFIFLSSSKVFSGEVGSYTENDLPHPISVYGNTKFRAEQLLESLGNVFVIRMGTLFGWGLPHHRALLNQSLTALWKGEMVQSIADEWRSFLSVRDLVEAIRKILEAPLSQTGTYHLSTTERLSHFDFNRAVAEQFSLSSDLVRPVSGKGLAISGLGQEVRGVDLTLQGQSFCQLFGWAPTLLAKSLEQERLQLARGV